MRIVYLVSGKIGSGKTTFTNELRNNGEIVINYDDQVHLFYKLPELMGTMISIFGSNCYDINGNPKTEFKNKLILDPKAFNLVEDILRPKLIPHIINVISNCFMYTDKNRIFLECGYPQKITSIIHNIEDLEGNIYANVKRILIDADNNLRKNKVAERWIIRNPEYSYKLTEIEILNKAKEYVNQLDEYQKDFNIGKYDYKIYNDYNSDIKSKVKDFINTLV